MSASALERTLRAQTGAIMSASGSDGFHGVQTNVGLGRYSSGGPAARVRHMEKGGQKFIKREMQGLEWRIDNFDALTLLARATPRIFTQAATLQAKLTIKHLKEIFDTQGLGTWAPNKESTIDKKGHNVVLRGLLDNPEPLRDSIVMIPHGALGGESFSGNSAAGYNIGWDTTPHPSPHGNVRISMAGLAILHEYGFEARDGTDIEPRPIIGLLPLKRMEATKFANFNLRYQFRQYGVPSTAFAGKFGSGLPPIPQTD